MSVELKKIICTWGNNNLGVTAEGGIFETFVNHTGPSVKGTIVIASTSVENGVDIAPKKTTVPIGVIYESGIEDNANVKVVVYGKAQVLLASDQAATKGNWCGVSETENGRMYQEVTAPLGTAAHNKEIGHSLQTSVAGSLSLVTLHFN